MSFVIRPAEPSDRGDLVILATSLSARGFLTLPTRKEELEDLIHLSGQSFAGIVNDPDQGRYLFVLEEGKKVIGCSLIIARHGTPESPHLFFEVDPVRKTLELQWETKGRTELGGLILDPAYRGHPAKLGKKLSFVRLLYIGRYPQRFREDILAELLPPFTADGKSPLWEALGRKWTGLGLREADQRSRRDKNFVREAFPEGPIAMASLPPEVRETIGQVGLETRPVARILSEVGFRYLNQVDPFDGGPHYGARLDEIKFGEISALLGNATKVKVVCP